MQAPVRTNSRYAVTPDVLAATPTEPASAVIRWLAPQSTDIWAAMIGTDDGLLFGAESAFLLWMIDQPQLELANAVRLFWKLFRTSAYLGRDAASGTDARRRDALCTLANRIACGHYPEGSLALDPTEVRAFRRVLSAACQEAAQDGLDPETCRTFNIPDAALAPLDGRPVALHADVVPMPDSAEFAQANDEDIAAYCCERLRRYAALVAVGQEQTRPLGRAYRRAQSMLLAS